MTGSARPQGITILAILSFIGGALGVLAGLAVVGFGGWLGAVTGTGAFFTVFGLIALVLGLAELAIGYGFWTLKPWAWSFAFIAFAVNILLTLLSMVLGGGRGITDVIVSIAIAAIVVYYLHQTNVRQAFNAPASGFPFVGNALDKYIPGAK